MEVNAKPKIFIIMLGLVFFGPFVLAWALASHGQDYIPLGKAAKGELIIPARPLTPFSLPTIDGDPLTEAFFRKGWTYVVISHSACEQTCQDNLYKIRQVRLTQGKNIHRVQRLLILTDAQHLSQFKHVLSEHEGLAVVLGDKQGIATHFSKDHGASALSGGIYLVDPLGNWFMQYQQDADPTNMRKDLTKLILNSQIG